MLELEVLVGEPVAVDGLATGAIALGEVTTLDHEVLNNAVELGAFVTVSELLAVFLHASSQGTEVLNGLGNGLESQVSHRSRYASRHLRLLLRKDPLQLKCSLARCTCTL